jgi:hypothetical protein
MVFRVWGLGLLSVECGVLSVECGVWGVEFGAWGVECGVFSVLDVGFVKRPQCHGAAK